jgi:hypothetical protein
MNHRPVRPAAAGRASTPAGIDEKYFVRPVATLQAATVAQLLRAGVDPAVARIDLEAVKANLRRYKRWSRARIEVAELEYKRMLTLLLWNPGLPHPLVPLELVDELWHQHILDTRAYHHDMHVLFGKYLHHFPFLGAGDADNVRLKAEAVELFNQLYQRTFGEPGSGPAVTRRLAAKRTRRVAA